MSVSVCHIVHWPRSGIGKVVENLIKFRNSDIHYRVITFNHCEQFSKELEKSKVEVETFNTRWSALTQLGRRLHEIQPDIIHSHSLYPMLLSKWRSPCGSKRISTLHTLYSYLHRNDPKSLLKRNLFCRINQLSNETVTAVSNEIVDAAPCKEIKNKMLVVENGIPTTAIRKFSQRKASFQLQGQPRIVSIGRLDKEKGFPVLIKAFARVREQHPNASLTIIGEGGERSRLQNISERLGISSSIFLPGYISNPFPVLAQADLFVNSSSAEGFGLTLAEAMILGIPVAATLTAGISAALSDGYNGYVADGFSVDCIEALLNRALGDPEREHVAKQGQKFSQERYGVEGMVQRYENLYKRLTSEPAKRW